MHSRDVRFNETERADKPADTETSSSDNDDTIIIDLSSDCEEETEEPRQLNEPERVRRSTRERRRPEYYGVPIHSTNLTLAQEPTSYREAISSPDQTKWRQAMRTEMNSLEDNHVWDLVELPSGRKKVGCTSLRRMQMEKLSATKLGWLHRDIRKSMELTTTKHSVQ